MKHQTRVTRIMMYPTRAKIFRETAFSLEGGQTNLTLEKLPAEMITESINITLQSESQVPIRLLGMDMERIHLEESPVEKIKELQDAIETLEDDIQRNQQQMETITGRIAHLDGLLKSPRSYAFGLASGKIDFSEHTQWLEDLSEQRDDLIDKRMSLEKAHRDLKKRLDRIRKTLSDLTGREKKTLRQIHCRVSAPHKTDGRLILSYDTREAAWKPRYDFRLEEPLLHVDIQAEVQQMTGEDWDAVQMTLSTAQPDLQAHLIDLDPWYINFAPQRRGFQKSPPKAAMMQGDSPRAAESEALFEIREPAAVAEQGPHVVYHMQDPVSIPSDAHPHTIQVAGLDLQAEADLQSAPRRQNRVVRRIRAENNSDFVLLPGPVQLFDGATYIGLTHIALIPKNADIEMPFGFEPRIAVEWDLLERAVEKQFLKDRRRINYRYQATLRNSARTEKHIQIHDHLPTPRNEEILVKIKELTPSPKEQDALNRITWSLSLPPGEERILTIAFSVDFPREKEVSGLP